MADVVLADQDRIEIGPQLVDLTLGQRRQRGLERRLGGDQGLLQGIQGLLAGTDPERAGIISLLQVHLFAGGGQHAGQA